ncbi:hypothetical protein OAH16_00825 [bacterium]|nr:hypothetical protein [bacterium]
MLKVLGLSFGFHDSAASLLINGDFVAGSSEERFSRVKNDNTFPVESIKFCLNYAGLDIKDLDHIVYYEDPHLKFSRICNASLKNNDVEYLLNVIDSWIIKDSFDIVEYISSKLDYPSEHITHITHHLSHASSAFFQSPFRESAILTIDAIGEYETTGIYHGKDNTIEKIASFNAPNSIGLLYSAFTAFLGFEVNEGEYKVMGMSAYGHPKYIKDIMGMIEIDNSGQVKINEEYFNFYTPKSSLYRDKFIDVFGKPREKNTAFFTGKCLEYSPSYLSDEEKVSLSNENQYYADIASSLQKVSEIAISKLVDTALKLCDSNYICMSGGVALNSVANGLLRTKDKPKDIFIQPNAGDAGSSLGAALYYSHSIKNFPRVRKFDSCYKGISWNKEDIQKALLRLGLEKYHYIDDDYTFFNEVTELMLGKNVLGWFTGRSEWGPRALGSRSIIANPSFPDMQEIVNQKIKFREPYRPFAPSVLAEHATEWFEVGEGLHDSSPESFMLSVVNVKENKRSFIPSVVHADGTARIQLVRENINPDYYNLINAFFDKTSIPMILNTSFNLKGEPIVNSPEDAIMTFSYCDMDYLIMKPFIISK